MNDQSVEPTDSAPAVPSATPPPSAPGPAAPLARALAAYRDGRIPEVERLCREVLAADRTNGEALHLLAVVTHRAGRNEAAFDLVRQAVVADPGNAIYLNTLGYVLRVLRRHAEAVQALRQALALREDYADAHNNIGIVYAEAGNMEAAESAYRAALRHRPDFAEVQNNLGNLLYRMGRIDEALAAYDEATVLRPGYAEAHANRGDAFARQANDADAVDAYRRAVEAAPAWAAAWYRLGNALFRLQRFEDARQAFYRAVDLNPNNPRVLTNLGATLEKLARYDEAAMILRHGIVLAPDDPQALKNMGHVVLKLGHVAEGLHLLRRAVALAPQDADAVYSLGNALLRMERLQEALDCYRKVRELTPDAARAYFAPASVLLMNGQYKEGWAAYESRFSMSAYKTNVGNVTERLWDGGPIGDRRVLVHVEQGFGDTLMFLRYLPLLRRALGPDAKILLLCEPELARIVETVDGYDELYRLRSDAKITYDLQVPLLSLPHRLGTTLESIPAEVPYIRVPAGTKARVARPKGTALTVAFVWAGRPTHSDDRFRSCPIGWFASLFDVPGVQFYSIQWGQRASEVVRYTKGGNVTDMSASLTDFAETLAIISQVDLVIAIDTAVAHLAGACGKPVWTLLAFGGEWRWLFRRDDSPWYPSMRLFRQQILGDWRPVFQRVRAELLKLAATGQAAGTESGAPQP